MSKINDIQSLTELYNDPEKCKEFKKSIDELRALDASAQQTKDDIKAVHDYLKKQFKISPSAVKMIVKNYNVAESSADTEIEMIEMVKDVTNKLNDIDGV